MSENIFCMKKIKLNIAFAFVLSLLILAGTSCNNFDDINTDPDKTTQVNASMLATNIILRVTKFQGRDAKAMIQANAISKYVGYANEGQLGEQYNWLGSAGFDDMTILPNIEKMLNYAENGIMEDSYRGVAAFSKAVVFYRMTMEMGDIPYSEAGKGKDGTYRVKYDTQEEVLRGVLEELKAAEQYFAKGKPFDGDPTPYKGNPALWRRAANAYALKVMMTLSKKESIGGISLKSRFAETVTTGALLEANSGYWGLEYSSVNKHPLSGTNDLFTSRTVPSTILVESLKIFNDRRLYYYAEPSVKQMAAGKTQTDPDAYIGVDVEMDYAAMNANHSNNVYSLINLRYLKEETSEPRRLMTFAEQQLILAEAVIKGWISGDAKSYYESGVKAALADAMATKASYAHNMPITQAYIDGYFIGEAAFKTNSAEQLEQIWMQRYFLNFLQESQSVFFDYRRTKYPEFKVNPASSMNANDKNAIPMRWLYPGSETNYNRENLEDALKRQYDGFDEINKLMWILK